MLIRNTLARISLNKATYKISFPLYSFKQKSKKPRAIIKPLVVPEDKEAEEKEELYIKPKGLNEDMKIFSQVDNKQLKEYYANVKDSIMDFDNSNTKMIIWYILNTAPLVVSLAYSPLVLWVHQVFWASTTMGLVFCSYELYSTKKEKKILDDHMNMSFLICNVAIGTGILNTMTTLEPIGMIVYIMNYIAMYHLTSNKNKEFFIPKWFSKSFKHYLLLMMLYTIIGLLYSSKANKKFNVASDTEVVQTYHKYIKQMRRICQEVDSNAPNLNFIKKQLLENK